MLFGNGVSVLGSVLSKDGSNVFTRKYAGNKKKVEKNWVGWVDAKGNNMVTSHTTANQHIVLPLGHVNGAARAPGGLLSTCPLTQLKGEVHQYQPAIISHHYLPGCWYVDGFTGVRGGACPTTWDDNSMLHVFHSLRRHPNGAVCYVAGALLFRREPPYCVTHITPLPLWKAPLLPPSLDRMNPRAAILYPAGIIATRHDDDSHKPLEWAVSAGWNDFKTCILTLKRDDLKFIEVPQG